MKYKYVYLGISAILVTVSLISLALFGLKPAIDFTGGALLEVHIDTDKQVDTDKLTENINQIENIDVYAIQTVTNENNYIIKMNYIDEPKKNEILDKVKEDYGSNITELRFETVGPTLGKELLMKTGVSVLLASMAILLYVAHQFKDKMYGISAILAMFHDTIILLGTFSLLGHFYNVEVDVLFVTALLTTLSFSVHDTIVVFDRIRESLKRGVPLSFEQIVDKAVTETLPRSLNNSLTIIFVLTTLALLGGVTIRWFVVALLVGTIAGTYSSTFVASPLLVIFMRKFRNKK